MERRANLAGPKASELPSHAGGPNGARLASPLSLDGWVEFNRIKWGFKPLRLRLTAQGKQLPALEAVLYVDRRGRIHQPNRNPYLPVAFSPTSTAQPQRLYRQWLSLSELLGEEFYQRGVAGAVSLSPEVTDVREFQWKGFLAEPRYTLWLDLPYSVGNADPAVRKQIAKATRLGYRCEQTRSVEDVCFCLKETEKRQGFHHNLEAGDLLLAMELLGDEVFRCYACYAPDGEVASARIVLRHPDGHALDWVAGTVEKHLTNGVTQLLISFVLDDLGKSGAVSFDYCGANIKTVAASKATWGSRLRPYYTISAPNLKGLARFAMRMWKYRRWL